MKNLLIIICFVTTQVFGATVTWDAGGDGIHWSDVSNWDCNCLPVAGDDVSIPSVYIATTVIVDINVSVESISCYAGLQVNSGAQINIAYILHMINGGDLLVQSGATIQTHNLRFVSVSHYSGQVWNADLNNYGTIQANHVSLQENCDPSYPCFTTITNDGILNTNDTGISFDDYSQIINNGTMNLNGSIGIQTHFAITNNLFVNNGNFYSSVPNYFGPTTNTASGTITIDNYSNYFEPMNYNYFTPVTILSDFNNQGTIIMTNPQANAQYGIQIALTGNFVSTGTLNITAQSYPIGNEGICSVEGNSEFHTIGSGTNLGIENAATFNILNGATTFTSTKPFHNLNAGVLSIGACKPVFLPKLNNYGSTINNGIITFDPTTTTVTITNTGTFANNGIMVNNPFTVNLSSAQNQGVFVQRILGQKCVDTPIPSFISGEKIDISNPTPGIFTDATLTTPAGIYNLSDNTFTPSAAAAGLTTLYMDLQHQSCAIQLVEIVFQYPITNPTIWYADADHDGYGNASISNTSCSQPLGYVADNTDCDDGDYLVHPGAPELCNDKDYNCDGMITGPAPVLWYQDADYDGYGNANVTSLSCIPPSGFVSNNTDCNDSYNSVYPGATEVCDNLDNNCNGMIDEGIPTGTATFTNGGINNVWNNPSNWSTGQVPPPCFNVIIPTSKNVIASGGNFYAKSILLQGGATLSITSATMTVQGGTSFGIKNQGTIIISNSNVTILNSVFGIDNYNSIQCSGNNTISINHMTQHGIQNNSAAIFVDAGSINMTLFNLAGKGISNSGNFTKNGYLSGYNIYGDLIYNTNTFSNSGNIDFQNGANFPQWVIHNQGIFNNYSGASIIFPTPSNVNNISYMGVLNTAGANLNNYGTMNLFGNTISGDGTFNNYGIVNGGF